MKSVTNTTPVFYALVISVSICLFAAFLHAPHNLQVIAGLSFIAAALFIYLALEKYMPVLLQKEVWQWPSSRYLLMAQALLVLSILALWYRNTEGMPLLPVAFERFVILSMLIGITEEIIFRGVIMGLAMRSYPTLSIFISALAFAGYKALLFVWPSASNQANPLLLFCISFIAGVYLGYLRKKSGSIWPCLLAHAMFDLIVYMETVNAPWWVW